PHPLIRYFESGGMAERSKAAVLKTVSGVTHSGVRIPLPPPVLNSHGHGFQPMTITLKEKSQLLVPPSVQRRARLKAGDKLQFKATPGIITIISKPPAAASEYTPAQRRVIDSRLALADEDVRRGRG